MKFMKGMILGGMVTAGIALAYAETMGKSKRKMMKTGRKMAKKMGII